MGGKTIMGAEKENGSKVGVEVGGGVNEEYISKKINIGNDGHGSREWNGANSNT